MPKQTKYEVHPTAAAFPFMPNAEYKLFKADIKANGVREPAIVKGNILIDGRHRVAACEELEIECPVREFDGDESQIVAFIISENLHRRHLTDDQRIATLAKIRAPEIKAAAAADKAGKGKKKGKDEASGDLFSAPDEPAKKPKGSAAKRLAEEAKTSGHKASQALETATHAPEVLDQVIAGKETLKTAAKTAKAKKAASKPPKKAKAEPTLLEIVGKKLSKMLDAFPITAHREVKEHIKTLIGGKNSELAVATALQKELAKIKPVVGNPTAEDIVKAGNKHADEKHAEANKTPRKKKGAETPAKAKETAAPSSESIFG